MTIPQIMVRSYSSFGNTRAGRAAPVKICHIAIRSPCCSARCLDLLTKGAIDLPTLDGGN
jgi:hypothetical protein